MAKNSAESEPKPQKHEQAPERDASSFESDLKEIQEITKMAESCKPEKPSPLSSGFFSAQELEEELSDQDIFAKATATPKKS